MRLSTLVSFAESLALTILVVCVLALLGAVAHASEPPDLCRCGIACDCAEMVNVAVITERRAPTVTVCKVTERRVPTVTTKTVTTTYSTRAPVGHTHTCTSCGKSWDHQLTKSHDCPFCGGHPPVARGGGYLADPVARPVTVMSKTSPPAVMAHSSTSSVVTSRASPAPVTYQTPVVFQSFRQAGGNCANGQCSSPSLARWR